MQLRVLAAAATLMLAGNALAQAPPPAAAPAATAASSQGLVVPGRSPELEILFTGDVVGYLEPCG